MAIAARGPAQQSELRTDPTADAFLSQGTSIAGGCNSLLTGISAAVVVSRSSIHISREPDGQEYRNLGMRDNQLGKGYCGPWPLEMVLTSPVFASMDSQMSGRYSIGTLPGVLR